MGTARSYGQLSDLINSDTEWGVSIHEKRAQTNVMTRLLKATAIIGYILAAFVAIPLVIGLAIFPDAEGMAWTALIVLLCVALAAYFQAQSKKGPRNAIQIDYSASEIRLGSHLPDGTFVRHRVCPFRQIDKVSIDGRQAGYPAICLHMNDELVKVTFQGADPRSLEMVAVQLSAARETAKKAPFAKRVSSVIFGIDATAREVGQRVRSRVVSRAV